MRIFLGLHRLDLLQLQLSGLTLVQGTVNQGHQVCDFTHLPHLQLRCLEGTQGIGIHDHKFRALGNSSEQIREAGQQHNVPLRMPGLLEFGK
ncbi:hypothetical protein D3C85_1680980 [compost metagenome]